MNKKYIIYIIYMILLSVSVFGQTNLSVYYPWNGDYLDYQDHYDGFNEGTSFVNQYPLFNNSGDGSPQSAEFSNTDRIYTNYSFCPDTPWTINVWIKMTIAGDNNHLVGQQDLISGDIHNLLYFHQNKINGYVYDADLGGAYNSWESTNLPGHNDGNWHMITLTSNDINTDSQQLYMDASPLVMTDDFVGDSLASVDDACQSLQFGDNGGNGEGFIGFTDEFSFYEAELTQEEIIEIYNQGVQIIEFDVANMTLDILTNTTNINNSFNISYQLTFVNTSANCSHYINDVFQYNTTGLQNNTYNFELNSSNWYQGNNTVLIECYDALTTVSDNVTYFVDAVSPEINYANYTDLNNQSNALNGALFSLQELFEFKVQTEDENNYLLNVTIFYNNSNSVVYSNETVNISTNIYTFSDYLNMSNFESGRYYMNITSKDAHTKNKIDFSKKLKDKKYNTIDYIGKIIDDKIKISSKKDSVYSFELIEKIDRKKFKLKFKSNVKDFSMVVEGDKSVEYLGKKYGYQGHFIIDGKYWYDLENEYNAIIVNVEKISNKKYIVYMEKSKYIDEITFDSIGIINSNTEQIHFDYLFSTVNVFLRDSSTQSLLTGLNMTVQYVGSNYQDQNITNIGLATFSTKFDSATDDVSIRAFQTIGNDYSLVIKETTLTQGGESNITLYLTNTSDTTTTNVITFEVLDQDYNLIPGATITIEKQDPNTNTYLHITDITTNSAGEASTILVTDTVFYRYYVTFQGNRIYTLSQPITISVDVNEIQIVAVIEQDYSEELRNILNTKVTAFNITYPNNSSGYFSIGYTTEPGTIGCLKIFNSTNGYLFNNLIEQTCIQQTYGSIVSSTFTHENQTLYLARFYVNYTNQPELFITQLGGEIGGVDSPLNSTEGIIVMMVIILVSALGFLGNPIMGLSFLAAGTIIVNWTGLMQPYMSGSAAITIVFISIISMYVVYSKK